MGIPLWSICARRVTFPAMALHPVTEKVLKLVEETTGLPVIVRFDPAMTTLASVKIAQGSAPAHFLTYNPKVSLNLGFGSEREGDAVL